MGGTALIFVVGCVAEYFYRKLKEKTVPQTQTVPTEMTQQPGDRERTIQPDPPAVPGYDDPTAPPPTYKDSRFDRPFNMV